MPGSHVLKDKLRVGRLSQCFLSWPRTGSSHVCWVNQEEEGWIVTLCKAQCLPNSPSPAFRVRTTLPQKRSWLGGCCLTAQSCRCGQLVIGGLLSFLSPDVEVVSNVCSPSPTPMASSTGLSVELPSRQQGIKVQILRHRLLHPPVATVFPFFFFLPVLHLRLLSID